ncbi:MAG: transglutaminase domain-containing protein, partial [Mycobacteriales bacterium]
GAYRGTMAYVVSAVGLVIGGLCGMLSYRLTRPAIVQWLTLPFALVAGAAFLAPDAATGTASFGNLVLDALRHGGLQQPPIPMDPGWRLILLVLFACMAVGTSALAVAFDKPKLSLVIAGPVTMVCSLVQPDSRTLVSTVGALLFLVAALAVSYSAELSGVASLTAGFELRRLVRSAVLAAGLAGVVLLLAQAGALFPQTAKEVVIPPHKPTTPPPQKDRQLFHVDGSLHTRPLRLGVLDEFDSNGDWLFPPYDTKRLQRLSPPVDLARVTAGQPQDTVRIHVDDIGGHAVPSLANATRIEGDTPTLTLDPRTGALQTADKPAFAGLDYQLTVPKTPTGKQLAAAPAAPPALEPFLNAPSRPAEVSALLQQYSDAVAKQGIRENGFDRLQFLRAALYRKVIAASAGKPAPASVSDIVKMLRGGEASPYQISEAEAVLARWAGVPSRIGFGYFGGSLQSDGSRTFRPKDGAAWLEVYFEGHGWVPIVGIPPTAKADTSTDPKNQNPAVRATDDLALVVYTPVRETGLLLLFQYVRYYVVRALGVAALLALVWFAYPVLIKRLRHRRRLKWASHSGRQEQIAATYVEFRDRMRDLAIGDPGATPMEFLSFVAEDDEHAELAWLVSRALWGDLARDLRQSDVDAATDLAASVGDRVASAHAYPLRIAAAVSRASLHDPYSREVPNLWPRLPMPSLSIRRLRHAVTLPMRLVSRLVPSRA